MASPGQKKGACGHIMASFDKHSRCAHCREKGHGDDPCVQNLQCDFCSVLTPEQVLKLSTPTYKLRKEKAKAKEVLVDPSSVVVLDTQPEQEPDVSVSSAPDLSLPVPQFKKDLQELDEKWSTRMARLEALITLGHRPSPSVQQNPSFLRSKYRSLMLLQQVLFPRHPFLSLLRLLPAQPARLLARMRLEVRMFPLLTDNLLFKTSTRKQNLYV